MSAELPVVYRLLLRVLSRRFRDNHRSDIEDLVGQMRVESGRGRLRLWTALVWDVLAHAPATYRFKRRDTGQSTREVPNRGVGLGLWLDMRHSARALRRQPTFTLVTVATLAIGIGITTAMFSVVRGVLLRPLPYTDAEQLANVWVDLGTGNQSLPAVSPGDYRDYQARSRAFAEFAAASGGNMIGVSGVLTGTAEPEQAVVSAVTANFFPLLGVTPMLGRPFVADEEAPNGPAVVILSERLWRRRYGSDVTIVGRLIPIDGVPHRIVAVLPAAFHLLLPTEAFLVRDADLWKPLQIDYRTPRPRNFTYLTVFGRLRPLVTFAQAQEDMNRIANELRREHVELDAADMRIRVVPLHDDVVKHARPGLLILFGAVAVVLLLSCTNIANLLLARGKSQQRELGIRSALGATRWRLMRLLLTETLLLAAMGGVVRTLLARGAVVALLFAAPSTLPRQDAVTIDAPVLTFAALTTVVAALLFGVAPAFRNAADDVMVRLRGSGTRHPFLRRVRAGDALIGCEVVLSIVLVVATGLLMRSFVTMHAIHPGFDSDGVLTLRLGLPRSQYPTTAARSDFVRTLAERLEALHDVTSVGVISQLPLTGSGPLSPYAYDEQTAKNWESVTADGRPVTSGYFRTMGTHLIAGRLFDDRDTAGGPRVVVVDTMLASRAWPGESGVGKYLQLAPARSPDSLAEVVGIVEHTRLIDLRQDVRGQIYYAFPQSAPREFAVVVRANGDLGPLAPVIRELLRDLDPALAVEKMQPMQALVTAGTADAQFTLWLIAAFAVVAVSLAGIGIYGVMSYATSRRTREIGIRLALGEKPSRITQVVVTDAMFVVVPSVAVGLAVSIGVGRLIRHTLYGVSPADGVTLTAATAVLLVVATIGCYLPARRATRIDPMRALRSES